MKPSSSSEGDSNSATQPIEEFEPTGVPGLKTWPAVYVFVLACFIISVTLLVALTLTYR